MPKPKRVDRPIMKSISLPQSIVIPVEMDLYSELEMRVPHGAWSRLISQLLREWLEKKGVLL